MYRVKRGVSEKIPAGELDGGAGTGKGGSQVERRREGDVGTVRRPEQRRDMGRKQTAGHLEDTSKKRGEMSSVDTRPPGDIEPLPAPEEDDTDPSPLLFDEPTKPYVIYVPPVTHASTTEMPNTREVVSRQPTSASPAPAPTERVCERNPLSNVEDDDELERISRQIGRLILSVKCGGREVKDEDVRQVTDEQRVPELKEREWALSERSRASSRTPASVSTGRPVVERLPDRSMKTGEVSKQRDTASVQTTDRQPVPTVVPHGTCRPRQRGQGRTARNLQWLRAKLDDWWSTVTAHLSDEDTASLEGPSSEHCIPETESPNKHLDELRENKLKRTAETFFGSSLTIQDAVPVVHRHRHRRGFQEESLQAPIIPLTSGKECSQGYRGIDSTYDQWCANTCLRGECPSDICACGATAST
ncbi:hypothetical protein HK104_003833 [Borealophlyctis nickersoniae]|nr:hypothetical protein HK104_003833 [Borealophlyctis nickersoniae]